MGRRAAQAIPRSARQRLGPRRRAPKAQAATAQPRPVQTPAQERAATFTRWMVAGALAGLILSLTQSYDSWAGAGVTSNLVQASFVQALGASIATGLLARGACWIWLARQA
ncbi:hypothetical protein GGQ83_001811 [Roseococcus suduntuyensis]|uniref:Uncharacterized protein n=2 Tax=Roseococcus suduntuyensis TaxID=455361 RepID=A0A840ADT5_9PROT|nr:hypothetical protein [Roseococcus suduntuyensis]